MELDQIKTLIEYHLDLTRHAWDSINEITDHQFLAGDARSRGSIRNQVFIKWLLRSRTASLEK